MNKDRAVVLLCIVFLIVVLFDSSNVRKERDLYKNQVKDDFKSKYLQLERELKSSERQRMVLVHHLDSIDNVNSVLVRGIKDKDSIILKIKGSYSRKTPSELENEMIKRFNERQ